MNGAKISILILALSFSLFAQGKNPVILIPGLAGSELVHKDTGYRVWFKALKPSQEDLRLPISLDIGSNRDNLVAGDVLRNVKLGPFPVTDVYGGFIKAMEARAGYHEEKWDSPSERGFEDSLYVYPYDWRLDTPGNARIFIRRIEDLKTRLHKPDLKFDVVGHSLGGLITRYAAMYGDADLVTGNKKPQPTWAGAKHFNRVILMGTPNEGSAMSLNTLLSGFTIGGLRIDLPFVHDTSRFTIFTIPSAYQLLPAPGTFKVFDDRLEPLEIDIYDPKEWSKYGWNPVKDKEFVSEFNAAERKDADAFFAMMLERAKRFHEALGAAPGNTGGVSMHVLGSDCRTALDAVVVYRDPKADRWKTLFRPKGFTRWDGEKITDDELAKIMISPGDGVVTRRSLEAASLSARAGMTSVVSGEAATLVCGEHNKLAANTRIQDQIIKILDKKAATVDNSTANPARSK